ncbi:MAG: polyhydroxyalkanoate depolymerase [Rubrimonas sp.]
MLYASYQWQNDILSPMRAAARMAQAAISTPRFPAPAPIRSRLGATMEMLARFELTHTRPPFGIEVVRSGGVEVPVVERVVMALPFGRLVHFSKPGGEDQPPVLVVAPLSGHFATLLRGTVRTLLRDHDVYITDWANARDVPVSAGRFGVEEHVDYLVRFIERIGPGNHVLAVCQPCVQTLAAVAVMSKDRNPATPLSMTLMAGPVDVRENPTAVNRLANERPLSWFRCNVITPTPWRWRGAGRRVYPGFLQLAAFMTMNLERHQIAHRRLFEHLMRGESAEAQRIKDFYDEYFAVLDLTEEFYLETIARIFQRAELAEGRFTFRGRPVDCGAIRRTALLTVEGGRDDICAMGQTAAAHELCRSLRPHLKRHHLQANVGHYGVFSGARWEREIYPVVRNMVLAVG